MNTRKNTVKEDYFSMPQISIIVPVYNVEKYLGNCIESVQNQSYKYWELILVDDGSPDKCGEICDEYASHDERIVVVHQPNGGQANARNHALDKCKGEYVTFLDSDDFLHQDYLKQLLDIAKKYDADIVQCDYLQGQSLQFPICNRKETIKEYNNHSIFLSSKANIIVWGKLYKRDIVLKNRIKEGKYYEDDFTTWKWYYNSKKIVLTSLQLYYYTDNPQSTMAAHRKKPRFDFMDAYKERIGFFVGTGERDLEHCSRLQYCKSLLLTYGHNKLSAEERKMVKAQFDESWKELKHSPYIKKFFKLLFTAFQMLPMLTSKVCAKMS